MKLNDLTERRFGRFIVIKRAENHIKPNGGKSTMWLCRCDCGNERVVNANSLLIGDSKSCGCLNSEIVSARFKTHGKTRTRLYRTWTGIKSRCYNKNENAYKYYGAKGIAMCDEWKNSFENFCVWAVENGYSDELTIDRIGLWGNYEPCNCRWANKITQANNKSNNCFLQYEGELKTIAQWSRQFNVDPKVVSKRLKRGWGVKDALEVALDKRHFGKGGGI